MKIALFRQNMFHLFINIQVCVRPMQAWKTGVTANVMITKINFLIVFMTGKNMTSVDMSL